MIVEYSSSFSRCFSKHDEPSRHPQFSVGSLFGLQADLHPLNDPDERRAWRLLPAKTMTANIASPTQDY